MESLRGAGLQVAFIATLMTLAGCATFNVDDAYRPLTSGQQDFVEVAADAAKLRVSFAPETKFFSVGLLVPVIPLGASTKRGTEVEMKVLATLPAGQSFSFAPVCLNAASVRLCPREVQAGIAYYYGGPAGLNWDSPVRWEIDATAPITDRDVFQHRPYGGEGDWKTLQLELSYLYACEGQCPDELSLSANELLQLPGRTFDTNVLQFRWRRKTGFEKVILQ